MLKRENLSPMNKETQEGLGNAREAPGSQKWAHSAAYKSAHQDGYSSLVSLHQNKPSPQVHGQPAVWHPGNNLIKVRGKLRRGKQVYHQC